MVSASASVRHGLSQAWARPQGQFRRGGAALQKVGYDAGIGHKCATGSIMGQRLSLLQQLAAARRHADEAAAIMQAQLDTFVSGMVVGRAMTKAEDVLKTSNVALQSHLSDIERILDALNKLPLLDRCAQS